MDTKYFTIVYKGVKPGEEAAALGANEKFTAGMWGHAMDERDQAESDRDMWKARCEAQAATLATVAPLVLELLGAVQMANHGSDCATLHGGTRCDCWKHALNEKARAFLSGATKESDHG